MLKYETRWRYTAPGKGIPPAVIDEFSKLIYQTARQGQRWPVIEFYKTFFADAAGAPNSTSSSMSWAESDLDGLMRAAAENAPVFIEAFFDACQGLQSRHPDWDTPDVDLMNRVLAENGTGYEIRPPNLIFAGVMAPVVMPQRAPSLDEQAQELIQRSLKQSDQLLKEGRNRQAVAEILWLLETVMTAFRGLTTGAGTTVQEKYFNKIASELRRQHRHQVLEQVLNWVTTLHGFLSSPTGGGVRHGTDIRNAVDMPSGDAQLYCNLIRSYIGYLMTEHGRLSGAQGQFS